MARPDILFQRIRRFVHVKSRGTLICNPANGMTLCGAVQTGGVWLLLSVWWSDPDEQWCPWERITKVVMKVLWTHISFTIVESEAIKDDHRSPPPPFTSSSPFPREVGGRLNLIQWHVIHSSKLNYRRVSCWGSWGGRGTSCCVNDFWSITGSR